MKSRKFQFRFLGILVSFITILIAILLAPVQIGGRVSYVIVSGSSMEPNYYKGDLVLTRKANTYQVGDVAAYNNKILGGVVIHRIVDIASDQYVLQGDNNSFLDRYQPTAEEVIGKEWLHLPKWGLYILKLREPTNFTIVLSIFVALILFPSQNEKGKEQKKTALKNIHRGGFMSSKEQTQELIASVFIVGLLALVVLVISFSNPLTELVNETSSFEHQGAFTYTASAISGVYDGTVAETGAPLFFNVSDDMELNFEYELIGYPLSDLSGTYRMMGEVRGKNGWTRTVEIVPETSFDQFPLTISGTIVFDDVIDLIRTFERLTEYQADPYLLTIVPEVDFEGKYRTTEVGFSFAPNLVFEVSSKSLELVSNNEENLKPKEVALTTVEVEKSGTLNFFSVEVPVATIRWLSIAVFVVSAAVTGWLVYMQNKILQAGGGAAVKYEYNDLIAEVRRKPLNKEMTSVESLEDLIVIAKQEGTAVFASSRGKFIYYFVNTAGSYYYFRLEDNKPEADTDIYDVEVDL